MHEETAVAIRNNQLGGDPNIFLRDIVGGTTRDYPNKLSGATDALTRR